MCKTNGQQTKWKRMELPGIDPGTSHMQSERSTIWATAPSAPQDVFKHDIRAFDVALIKSVSKKWTMELRGIDPRTSHMLSERSTTWATAPVHCSWIETCKYECQALRNNVSKAHLTTQIKNKKQKMFLGAAGYRSPYLSHAKRALYHLSYSPGDLTWREICRHSNSLSWPTFGAPRCLSW